MDLNQKVSIYLMARHEKVEKQFICCHLYAQVYVSWGNCEFNAKDTVLFVIKYEK